MEQEKQEDEYGEEEGDDEDGNSFAKDKMPKEKPVMPQFNLDEFMEKWVEENPEPQLPDEIVPDIDNDWIL